MSYETKTVIEDGIEYEVRICINDIYWTLNGKRHREKGPATIWPNAYKSWWHNGFYYRLDGPAEIWANGYKRWRINRIEFTEQKHTKVRTILSLGLDKI
jgi:hypothetical protein